MTGSKSVCVIGVGNPLMSDDGAGAYVCRKLDALALPQVTVMEVHQLQTELLADLAGFTHLVIVDAGLCKSGLLQSPLLQSPANLSHHLSPDLFKSLLKQVYHAAPEIFIIEVPAADLGYGEGLTAEGLQHAETAYRSLLEWLQQQGFMNAPGV